MTGTQTFIVVSGPGSGQGQSPNGERHFQVKDGNNGGRKRRLSHSPLSNNMYSSSRSSSSSSDSGSDSSDSGIDRNSGRSSRNRNLRKSLTRDRDSLSRERWERNRSRSRRRMDRSRTRSRTRSMSRSRSRSGTRSLSRSRNRSWSRGRYGSWRNRTRSLTRSRSRSRSMSRTRSWSRSRSRSWSRGRYGRWRNRRNAYWQPYSYSYRNSWRYNGPYWSGRYIPDRSRWMRKRRRIIRSRTISLNSNKWSGQRYGSSSRTHSRSHSRSSSRSHSRSRRSIRRRAFRSRSQSIENVTRIVIYTDSDTSSNDGNQSDDFQDNKEPTLSTDNVSEDVITERMKFIDVNTGTITSSSPCL